MHRSSQNQDVVKATPPQQSRQQKRATRDKRQSDVRAGVIAWRAILRTAQQRFGIEEFRPGQKEVLEEVFSSRSVLGLMPTGAGKSLTYQLPALFLPKPVVVVSPLIALMQDQQQHAAAAEIQVEKIDSTLTVGEAKAADEQIESGKAQLIYVTPEQLEDAEFVQALNDAGGISLLVVDEAHCIAHWGHDFRPAYLAIGEARQMLGMPPVLALTATATATVINEILNSLKAEGSKIVNAGTVRANLIFSVRPTVNTDAKMARVLSMLEQEDGTGIIYTASVRTADDLYEWLKEHGISAGRYHGKMKMRDRKQAQDEFMRGDHKVMIATKAFGLGIDKADIRFVYHFEFPDSLETYYQEAGRAGRDGLPSRAVLLYRLEDKRVQSFFLAGRYPSLDEVRSVAEALGGRVLTSPVTGPDAVEAVPASVPAPGECRADAVLEQTTYRATMPQVAEGEGKSARAEKKIISADAIAAQAQVGRRKTQVILHLLREAGMIQRGKRGYVLRHTEPPTDNQLTCLLQAYRERAQRDKDRLAEMMRYAETADCRVRVIRSYFGDEHGERCGQCDSCERARTEAGGRVGPNELDGKGARLQGRVAIDATADEVRRADEAHDGSVVTRVETMHGTIVTTAPETLPQRQVAAEVFTKAQRVRHKKFGEGEIRDTFGDIALVRFAAIGEKRLKVGFLTAL